MEPTEEQLKAMSPAQILQLQKQNCIFCRIISGSILAKKVYETPSLIALVDINPANPGHIILIPKEHYQIMALMPDDVIGEFFAASKLVSQSMLKVLRAEGTSIFAANGTVAGQRAPHFMLHIIPRFEGDGVNLQIVSSNADHASVEALIRAKARETLGIPEDAESEAIKKDIMAEKEPQKMGIDLSNSEKKKKEKQSQEREIDAEEESEEAEETNKKEWPGKINLDDLADFLSGKK